MSDTVDVNIRLDDHPVASRHVLPGSGWWPPSASVEIVDNSRLRVRFLARDPGVLRDLGHALVNLADDLEVAQRPYVGDEDAERSPAIALMRRGLAEMRNDLARGDEDADRGEAS